MLCYEIVPKQHEAARADEGKGELNEVKLPRKSRVLPMQGCGHYASPMRTSGIIDSQYEALNDIYAVVNSVQCVAVHIYVLSRSIVSTLNTR